MKIVERKNIDTVKWDSLVEKTKGAGFYSYSWYMDAVAENWCVLVNHDYSEGIALPYTTRLGVDKLYAPIFVSYVEFLGSQLNVKSYEEIIKIRFKNIYLSTKQKLFTNNSEEYVTQKIEAKSQRVLSSQAKRMLKKAEKNNYATIKGDQFNAILETVREELTDKYVGITKQSLNTLEILMKAAKSQGVLSCYELKQGGGIVCLENESQIFYLKGTVTEEVKKNGGMYLALNSAIETAVSNNKVFDFGGSRISGVKKFNSNLGGEDISYYFLEENKAPLWHKVISKIYFLLKK
mgnify:CR=1 FL=1